ncbi:hypothetical protein K439DRAFT_773587 [Ramaria rubella]|nr:hypothetical protein K439DRAFT_773587 [Ramaria rubella]
MSKVSLYMLTISHALTVTVLPTSPSSPPPQIIGTICPQALPLHGSGPPPYQTRCAFETYVLLFTYWIDPSRSGVGKRAAGGAGVGRYGKNGEGAMWERWEKREFAVIFPHRDGNANAVLQ